MIMFLTLPTRNNNFLMPTKGTHGKLLNIYQLYLSKTIFKSLVKLSLVSYFCNCSSLGDQTETETIIMGQWGWGGGRPYLN
jgi:hypothetical protein